MAETMMLETIAAACGIASGLAGLVASAILFAASRQSSDTQAAMDGLQLLENSLTKKGEAPEARAIDTAQAQKDLFRALLDERIEAKKKERLAAGIFVLAFLAIFAQSLLLFFAPSEGADQACAADNAARGVGADSGKCEAGG